MRFLMVSSSLAPETVSKASAFPQVVGATLKQHVCLSSERWRVFFYCDA